MDDDSRNRIAEIELDEASLAAGSTDAVRERQAAIKDLLAANRFELVGKNSGPYALKLSTADNRLVIDVRDLDDKPVAAFVISLSPFRGIIRDYFLICESYHQAVRNDSPDRIEAVDMGRRGLHNEGSELLLERLKGKAEMDFDTARRLFTLVCALYRAR